MNDERFILSDKLKKFSLGLIAVGIITLIIGLFVYSDESSRIWANVLLNSVFFSLIALAGVFFIAVHTVGLAGWFVLVKRIPSAMGTFLPVGFVLMLIVGLLGMHDIYEWSHQGLYTEGSAEYDELIAGKHPYLNFGFFIARMIVYFGLWIVLAHFLRKTSLQEDVNPDTKHLKRSIILAAIFLVVFAISTSMASWDWLMSIDPHWYSTLFGWYMFASFFVSGIAMMTLIVIYLKKQGYLTKVNESHLHDLGKYMFAFSIFWTYLWFSQFMLIWYANIPEETIYFKQRLDHYNFLFFANFVINFILPFLVLMTRGAKRKMNVLIFVAVMLLLGHWIDFYLMIFPGVSHHIAHTHWYPGLFEIGMTLGYVGLFILVVFHSLSKTNLTPKNHPYLEESTYHSI